jgi:hypothetical protein
MRSDFTRKLLPVLVSDHLHGALGDQTVQVAASVMPRSAQIQCRNGPTIVVLKLRPVSFSFPAGVGGVGVGNGEDASHSAKLESAALSMHQYRLILHVPFNPLRNIETSLLLVTI